MLTKYTFYLSFHDALKDLDDATYGRIVRALSDYAFFDTEPQLNGIDKMFMTMAKPLIDIARKRADAGRLGGMNGKGISRNVGNQNASKTNTNQKQNISKTIADKDNMNKEKEIGVKESVRRFTPPTVDDVKAYCEERRNNINPQSFIDFYESKGWMVGSNTMKDWKAAVRTWEQRHTNDNYRPIAGQSQNANVSIETDRMGNHIAVFKDGFRCTLGIGEYIDKEGNRRYSEHQPPIPRDASPRPGNDYSYSRESGNWITGF